MVAIRVIILLNNLLILFIVNLPLATGLKAEKNKIKTCLVIIKSRCNQTTFNILHDLISIYFYKAGLYMQ